jgi:tripartite-type tricarboxylate transporter receptor subunit TctC
MRYFRILAFNLVWPLTLPMAQAQTRPSFYSGKTVTLVVSSSPGGGYDMLSRTLARYLPKHIPGMPSVVIRNMPGAGGIVATNYLANVAPRDGLTIGGVQNNTPFEPLFGTKEASYDSTKFNWLGSPTHETATLLVWHSVPVNNLEDAQKRETMVSATGANSTPAFYARLLNQLLGLKLKVVNGYPGQNEAFMAMEKGEVEGLPSVFWSSLSATRPDWVSNHKVQYILQYGPVNEVALGSAPNAMDLLSTATDKALLQAAIAPLALGRPFLMPPGIPADRVAVMQKAMMETFTDPEFLAQAKALKLGLNTARSGDEARQVVDQAYATSSDIVERLRSIAVPK